MDIGLLLNSIIKIISAFVLAIVSVLLPTTTVPELPQLPATAEVTSTTEVAGLPAQAEFPAATSTPTQPKPGAKPVATQAPAATPAMAPQQPALDTEVLNERTRAALVNILCTTKAGGSFKPISGSGVVVDSRGVILTNAHVAQYFLLRNYPTPGNIECVVRTGSPAQTRYTATLLYLPPQWIADNATQITAQQAVGTGENDYAFLLITGTTNPSTTLPVSFPHLPMTAHAPALGAYTLLAAYPAGFLSGELIATNLYASSAFAYVTQLYSYSGEPQVDLFSIGGSIASQSGSSGGAAVTTAGELAGIIATATLAPSTGERDLRAVSLGHVTRSLAGAGKGGVAALLAGDVAAKAAEFNATEAVGETRTLEAVLNRQ